MELLKSVVGMMKKRRAQRGAQQKLLVDDAMHKTALSNLDEARSVDKPFFGTIDNVTCRIVVVRCRV
jgi:hypothetical protein